MKNIFKTLSILSLIALSSCETTEKENNTLPQANTPIQKELVANGFTFKESNFGNKNTSSRATQNAEIYGIQIPTGMGRNCENNILVFDSWDTYTTTIENLDLQIDTEADAFDATVPAGTTDDQYDILADAAGFDEDNPLKTFEDDLGFCSLRKRILVQEEAWLDLQGNGVWDAEQDPDNHFIDDDTERALLGESVDVFVNDREKGLIYYHFTDDEGGYIMVYDMDLVAIKDIVNGVIPSNNPNVVVVVPPKPSGLSCKDKVTEIAYPEVGQNKIKRISKIRYTVGTSCKTDEYNVTTCKSISGSKIKAKTKGYKIKRGKWRPGRTTITAGITAQNETQPGLKRSDCVEEDSVYKEYTKRRRKVKVKVTGNTTISSTSGRRGNFTVEDNKLYSFHKQGSLTVNKDFYDMPN